MYHVKLLSLFLGLTFLNSLKWPNCLLENKIIQNYLKLSKLKILFEVSNANPKTSKGTIFLLIRFYSFFLRFLIIELFLNPLTNIYLRDQTRFFGWQTLTLTPLKGVFARNYRWWSLLILLLSVASEHDHLLSTHLQSASFTISLLAIPW